MPHLRGGRRTELHGGGKCTRVGERGTRERSTHTLTQRHAVAAELMQDPCAPYFASCQNVTHTHTPVAAWAQRTDRSQGRTAQTHRRVRTVWCRQARCTQGLQGGGKPPSQAW
jgi:hypothetical protein